MSKKPKPARVRALTVALAEAAANVREVPPGSNWGPRVSEYITSAGYTGPVPWCMCFQHWSFRRVGVDLGGWGSVGMFEQWAVKHGYQQPARPLRGDLVCYRWGADDWPDHVGIVDRVLALRWKGRTFTGWVRTVEGNTSSGKSGSQDDGDGVYVRRRWIVRAKFVRVPG
jgi:hypothetical protein